jgi:hypothetical protein
MDRFPVARPVTITDFLRAGRRVSRAVRPRVGEGMWIAQMAIVAIAAVGMFVAVMLLVLGLSRRRDRRVPGRRPRARRRHDHPWPRPPANANADRAAYGPPSLWGDVPDDPHGWR